MSDRFRNSTINHSASFANASIQRSTDVSLTVSSVPESVMNSGRNFSERKKMYAHFRPNEFLQLRFDAHELLIGYNVLKALYMKTPSEDLAKMIKVMEGKLFPPPKLMLVGTHHLCEKCCQMLNTTSDRYHVRTDENGVITWSHQVCPTLKPDSERENIWK